MIKRLITIAVAAFLAASSLQAQNNGVTWNLDLGVTSSALYDAGHVGGYGVGAGVGVVLMPIRQMGFRVTVPVGLGTSINRDPEWKLGDKYFQSGISLDVMWDIRETFSKEPDKRYHIQPYFRLSEMLGTGNKQIALCMALGAGLRQVFSINERFGILLDMNVLMMSERPWRNTEGKLLRGEVCVGVSFAL